MDSPADEARLDTMMRESTSILDDAGFSDRVLSHLPPPRLHRRLRAAVLMTSTSLAVFVAMAVLGPQALVLGLTSLALPTSFLAPASLVGAAIVGLLMLGASEALSGEA